MMKSFRFLVLTILTASLIVALGLGIQFLFASRLTPTVVTVSPSPSVVISPTPKKPTVVTSPILPPRPIVTPERVETEPLTPTESPLGTDEVYQLPPLSSDVSPVSPTVTAYLGHLPYQEDDPQRLVQVGTYYDRVESLDIEAAEAFNRLKADAQANGINLIIISGFRTVAYQEGLFQKQIQRLGSPESAARLSAPPGYSEHHTGYAIDIGDGNRADTDLKYEFENTEAYRWLSNYAHQYGFELSFKRNNHQGVSFEPWHWRYLGSARASQIFAAARS